MKKPEYHIASFSGGKDSTAMVLHMIERGDRIDEVMFCDTTVEFPAMLRHVEKVRKVVEAAGVKFTILRAPYDFEYYMLYHKPKRKKQDLQDKVGYSWPGNRSRWCTRALKVQQINQYLRTLKRKYKVHQYVGLAADETYRLERENNKAEDITHPLVDWGWTEADALGYCIERGYDWEGLYDIFHRVSCWLCPLQSIAELRKLKQHFPDLWEDLREMDDLTWRTFKPGYSVRELEIRFALEDALTAAGHSIKNRKFFTDLRRVFDGKASIAQILADRKKEEEWPQDEL